MNIILVTVRPTNQVFVYRNLKRCWHYISAQGYDRMMVMDSEEISNGKAKIKTYLNNYVGMWRYFFQEHKVIVHAYNSDKAPELARTYILQETVIM